MEDGENAEDRKRERKDRIEIEMIRKNITGWLDWMNIGMRRTRMSSGMWQVRRGKTSVKQMMEMNRMKKEFGVAPRMIMVVTTKWIKRGVGGTGMWSGQRYNAMQDKEDIEGVPKHEAKYDINWRIRVRKNPAFDRNTMPAGPVFHKTRGPEVRNYNLVLFK